MTSNKKTSFKLTNYKKVIINVIIFSFLFILVSCEASEKAEKKRYIEEFKTVSLIPVSEKESSFYQTEYKKNKEPDYPF
jgi:hypothetical protein